MKKRISLVVIAAVLFVFALVEYILSFSSYDDGGYFGFSFSQDALIVLISTLVLVLASIYHLYGFIQQKQTAKALEWTAIAFCGFHVCYSAFTTLKIVAKAVGKLWENEPFVLSYEDVSTYIPWFFISLAFLIYFIFQYKENQNQR